MEKTDLEQWQQNLLARLERGLGRELVAVDYQCVEWSQQARTLTVVSSPLRNELRTKNLISNVFRSQYAGGHTGKDAR